MAWGDYDNDGYDDMLVAGYGLLHNEGSGRWRLVESPSVPGRSSHWGDYDNDGFLDHVGTFGFQLSHNSGGTLEAADAVAAGLIGPSPNFGDVAWLDADADGWLDLAVFYDGLEGNLLFLNNGDGTFRKLVGADTGIVSNSSSGTPLNGETSVAVDYDGDGWTDLLYYVNTLRLYRNLGAAAFMDASASAGVGGTCPVPGTGYCALTLGDYDNDGHLDLFVGQVVPDRLYHAQGNGSFTEVGAAAGVAGFEVRTVGAAFGDYDLDGDLDLAVARTLGISLYNNSGGVFTDVAEEVGLAAWVPGGPLMWADADGDGDLDLAIATERALFFYRNELGGDRFLKVRPVGRGAGGSPRDGTGARVELWDAGGTTLRAVRVASGAEGLGSHAPRTQHFGLSEAWGGAGIPYLVRVRFTGGMVVDTLVVPRDAALTIGGTVFPQTIEVHEP